MKRPLMLVVGCGVWMLAATLLSGNPAAEDAKKEPATKTMAVNHRNEKYDTNKDAKLDEAEIVAMKADRAAKKQARLLAKYDANKNGVIDTDEESVHQADLEKRRLARAERKKAKEAEKAAAAATTPEDDDDEDEAEAVKKP